MSWSAQPLDCMQLADDKGIFNRGIQVLHVHILLVAPPGADHIA